LVFPSVRDFGAGVVFEALASGAVPIVADFGGPGDIVHPEVGYKVPLTNEGEFVARMQLILHELASDRLLLDRLRRQGMAYARESLTWEAKAERVTKILNWVVYRGFRPELPPPKVLYAEHG
jgi:glycosyltransferase involved in cell wall biosynthesis